MNIELPPEMEQAFLKVFQAEAVRVARDLSWSVRLVSTETAAGLLEVSANTFLAVMRERGIEPVRIGPRLLRWRMSDLQTLVGKGVA